MGRPEEGLLHVSVELVGRGMLGEGVGMLTGGIGVLTGAGVGTTGLLRDVAIQRPVLS